MYNLFDFFLAGCSLKRSHAAADCNAKFRSLPDILLRCVAVKSFGVLGVSSVTAHGVKMEENPSANALQRAGGYSFNFAVRNCPCSSVPMVCARGK